MKEKKFSQEAFPLIGIILAFAGILLAWYGKLWLLALISGGGLVLAVLWLRQQYHKAEAELKTVIADLETKVNILCEDLNDQSPVITLVIDGNGNVLWHNKAFSRVVGKGGQLRGKIVNLIPGLHFQRNSAYREVTTPQIGLGEKIYRVTVRDITMKDWGRRAVYLEDISEFVAVNQRMSESRPVACLIQVDNYEEVLQSIDDEKKPLLVAEIDKLLGEWVISLEGLLRKYAQDRYLLVINNSAVREAEKNRFDILDKVREINLGNKIPVTLSIGVGVGEESFIDLGRLAHGALDLALGRGGDQVVIKSPDKIRFYGGKSKAPEKRTRVKARVFAYSLREMLHEADKVLIMGHRDSDFDSLGSSLGMVRAMLDFKKEVYLVYDNPGGGIGRLIEMIQAQEDYQKVLISPEEAQRKVTQNTLLIVVDTHKPSLVIEPELLGLTSKVVVIDHHRRAEEFIDEPVLVYLEPYASSTSELVAEVLQYLGDEVELIPLEATAMLAGIAVDTKNFIFQTGVRTFEAATYLRRSGADPAMVQQLLRSDLETVLNRAEVIKHTEIYFDIVAVATHDEVTPQAQLLAAQAADILLNINGIKASFVLCPSPEGVVISARSDGDLNVQVMMEELGGGGHFSVAGTQLAKTGIDEAKQKLLAVLEKFFREEEFL